jgi:hypothetical protein
MPETSLVVVDPGHFHATLVQQQMHPELSPVAPRENGLPPMRYKTHEELQSYFHPAYGGAVRKVCDSYREFYVDGVGMDIIERLRAGPVVQIQANRQKERPHGWRRLQSPPRSMKRAASTHDNLLRQ